MSRLALAVLAAALASCRKPPIVPPTAEALGAELATFPQLLAPLTPKTVDDMLDEMKMKGTTLPPAPSLEPQYLHGTATVNGKNIPVFVGYATPWKAPKGAPLQAMSVLQFVHAFAADTQTDVAMIVAPKGNIYFTREQEIDVFTAARAAKASSADLPFTMVRGGGPAGQ